MAATRGGAPDRRQRIQSLSGAYLVGMARLVALSSNHNFATALISLAITRANVRGLVAFGEAALRDPDEGEIPPEGDRTPVTVYALARRLGLPYETVRRHVGKLRAAGLGVSPECGLQARGLGGPLTPEAVEQCWRQTVAFVDDAAALGMRAPGGHPPAGPQVARHIVRLATEYFLDGMRLMAQAMDLDVMAVLVLRTVTVGNIARLARDPTLARIRVGLADMASDEDRVPVSVYAVSKFLLLPYETARRTLLRLTDLGLVERRGGGLVVPVAVVARSNLVGGLAALIEGFLGRLAEVGVVALAEALPDAAAA